MKKQKIIPQKLFIVTALVLIASCAQAYDARWYRQSSKKSANGNNLTPVPDAPPDVGFEVPPADEDTFTKPDSPTADSAGFNASKFDTWQLSATFDGDNVPSYNFSPGTWTNGDAVKKEYYYNGTDSSAGGNSITSMKYYQYRGMHPHFPADNSYNKDPHNTRLTRFYFYRFTGRGGGIVNLDNALMAVDTYSKLVYAYAKPTELRYILGNATPIAWGPFEINVTVGGKQFKFYEYDPIGWVSESGAVTLYPWFKTLQAAGKADPRTYIPKLSPPTAAVAGPSGPGKSPYAPSPSVMGDQFATDLPKVTGTLTVSAKNLKNISVRSRFYTLTKPDGEPWDGSYFNWEFRSLCYEVNPDVALPKADVLAHKGKGSILNKPPRLVAGNTQWLDMNQTVPLSGTKSYTYTDCTRSIVLELDATVNIFQRGAAGTIKTSQSILDKAKPTFPFKYDRAKNAWIVETSSLAGTGVTVSYDKNFKLEKNEEKDFEITVVFLNKHPYNEEATIKLCYGLKWE